MRSTISSRLLLSWLGPSWAAATVTILAMGALLYAVSIIIPGDAVLLGRRVGYRISGITQRGFSPRATRCTLSKALRKAFGQFSHVGPAECGVKVTFSTPKRGWLMSGGSSTMTSSPAAEI